MTWRQSELARYGNHLEWLDGNAARAFYTEALQFSSKSHYGLEPSVVERIERFDVDDVPAAATVWLAQRIGTEQVCIVFGPLDVCRMESQFFVSEWQDMFGPSRDDVIVLPTSRKWVLFYWHEDEFEFGVVCRA